MVLKLFGGKKSNEFFLELDESKSVPTQTKVEEASPTPVVQEPVAVAETPEAVVAETVAEKPTKTPKASKSKKTSVKDIAPKASAPAPQPPVVVAAAKQVEPKEVNFATNLFVPSQVRRSPGPSLKVFQDMARDAKIPVGRR
jgi:hypothetical protein